MAEQFDEYVSLFPVHPAYLETFAKLEDTHFWFVSRRRIFFDLLDRELGERRDLRVLEIGCGAGGLLGPLQRYGTVHGLDVDLEYVQFCRNRGFDRVLCVGMEGGADWRFD